MSIVGFIEMNGVLKLILANSWDKTWGVGGYALVSLEAVDYLAQRPYTALVGVSDLTGFDRVRVLKSFSGVG